MVLSKLSESSKVVGAKQTKRALTAGKTAAVYLAEDADPRVTEAIRELSRECQVPVYEVPTMKKLGQACGIAVGAAVAAQLR